MISTKEIFKSHLYPDWISSNPIFKKIDHVRKVFPSIGIDNFEEKVGIDNSKEITNAAIGLIVSMQGYVLERQLALENFAKTAKIGKIRRQKLTLIIGLFTKFIYQLDPNSYKSIINIDAGGKASLILPSDLVFQDEVFLKKGTSIFKTYEKFNSLLLKYKFLELNKISNLEIFKIFSSINVPFNHSLVKFSSDGADGIWDISTMSMRGINSCQSWTNAGANNSGKLIGSIVDPFTGIIYITNNSSFNEYGSKMSRRCIVRYVIDGKNKSPHLLLEKMYPSYDNPSLGAFIFALQKRTKLPIISSYNSWDYPDVYIPISDELKLLDNKHYPYCDSTIPFKRDVSCSFTHNIDKLREDFLKISPVAFKKALRSRDFTKAQVKGFGETSSKIMSDLRRQDKNEDKNILQEKIAERFTSYVYNNSVGKDPRLYLSEPECMNFFQDEFGSKTNEKFSSFLGTKVISTLKKELSLR